MCIDKKELHSYKSLNLLAHKNSVVILGSTYMKEMPVGELRQVFGILSDIYNRSLTDLSIFEAKEVATNIIKELSPSKIILHLGESDLASSKHSEDEIITEFSNIISSIRKLDKKLKIVIVSINNLENKELQSSYNSKLEALVADKNCVFADITSAMDEEDTSHIQSFRLLRYFMADDCFLQII